MTGTAESCAAMVTKVTEKLSSDRNTRYFSKVEKTFDEKGHYTENSLDF
jgi:hypothetical protein